jgi:predicted nucleic acid-binding protein
VIFIDTNVAIDLRDNPAAAGPRLAAVTPSPVISLVTRIELESGVERNQSVVPVRRALLSVMLRRTQIALLTLEDVVAYGRIVAAAGFDRRRILDRLIAAQTLTRNAELLTANPRDFEDIDGIRLVMW